LIDYKNEAQICLIVITKTIVAPQRKSVIITIIVIIMIYYAIRQPQHTT